MFWQAYRYILQNMDKKDSHIELLDRFFRGLTSPEEDVQLKSWIKRPDFQQKFSAYYQQCWALAPDTMDKAVQNEMFTELLSQIDASSTTETKVLKTRNRFLRQIGRYAAVACIILAVGSGAYYAGVKRPADDANTEVTMSVSNGQKADIILADGTKVYINSDSRIVYDNTYNKKTRMVSLEGEAYFEVAKDKEKPFIVKANGINVQALGTSFNIRAHKDDKSVAVILISGKVKVDDGRHEAYMKPNERLVCNLTNGQFEKSELHPNASYLLWRSNELAFYGESFEEICTMLTRMYNCKFIFKNEKVKQYTYHGIIKNSSLNNVLEYISQAGGINYKIKSDNTIVIYYAVQKELRIKRKIWNRFYKLFTSSNTTASFRQQNKILV
mgnify:FL=1